MNKGIDELIYAAVFDDEKVKKQARAEIRRVAQEKGIFPASINNLYRAIGRGEVKGFTVPAINIRMMAYDTARIVFQLMKQKNIGALIFEIARSEITYTDQRPDEYAVAVLVAAIKEDYKGPVFIQGDHFQFSKSKFSANADEETGRIQELIKEAISAHFYNIDIDASTLVDTEKEDQDERQKTNYEVTAKMTDFIRSLQPKGVTISIGGEIDHIGGTNSTVESFEAFMKGYTALVKENGISKISVQTGTTHGGVPLPDGTMAEIKLDFSVLRNVGKVAREKYELGGAVQHGASTLPEELFGEFPKNGALEIHLATGFQNIVYANMPSTLRNEMEKWTQENCKDEWEDGWNKEQFIYKTRKKAIGPFKEKLWKLSDKEKDPIRKALAAQFTLLFDKLNVVNTREIIARYVH